MSDNQQRAAEVIEDMWDHLHDPENVGVLAAALAPAGQDETEAGRG